MSRSESAELVVSVDGGELRGRAVGAGDALLVLHGGPGLGDYSDMFIDELAGWRALCYTQRGPSPSVVPGPYSVAGHVADAIAVLDNLDVERAVVLGHSWGVFLACALAAAAPERVAAMVLLDGIGLVGDGGEAEFGAALMARTPPDVVARMGELDDARQDDVLESLRLLWPAYFADPAAAPPPPAGLTISVDCHEQTFDSLRDVLAAGSLTAALARFPGPVELVYGAASPMPATASTETAALFPNAVVTAVPDAGHFLWVEQPGSVRAALARVATRPGLL